MTFHNRWFLVRVGKLQPYMHGIEVFWGRKEQEQPGGLIYKHSWRKVLWVTL